MYSRRMYALRTYFYSRGVEPNVSVEFLAKENREELVCINIYSTIEIST